MAAPAAPLGLCKCCLKTTHVKNMWEPQEYNGQWEVYGQMIVDCFGIDWTIITVEDDNICQVCISKLRVATALKQQVLESQAITLQEFEEAALEEIETTHRVQVETIPTMDGKEVEVTFVPTAPLDKTSSEQDDLNSKVLRKNYSATMALKNENVITVPLKTGNATPTVLNNNSTIAVPFKTNTKATIPTNKSNPIAVNVTKDDTATTVQKEITTTTILLKKDNSVNSKKENTLTTHLKKESTTTSPVKKDNTITTPVKKDKTITTLVTKDNTITSPVKKDKTITTLVTKDNTITSPVTKDKTITTLVTKDNTITSPVKKDKTISTLVTKDNTITTPVKKENTASVAATMKTVSIETDSGTTNELLETERPVSYETEIIENNSTESNEEITLYYEGSSESGIDENSSFKFQVDEKIFEEVEFLDEEVLDESDHVADDDGDHYVDDGDYVYNDEDENNDEDFVPASKKQKGTKGPPRGKRNMYKMYSADDVKQAVEAVRSTRMSYSEAARVFKVPRETIGNKAQHRDKEEDSTRKVFTKQLIKALRALVTHTNATPFKVSCQGSTYKCFFCMNQMPAVLQQPDDLRKHTLHEHPIKYELVEFAVRPPYLNQMVRVDIHNLKCKCSEDLTWDNLHEHLQYVHGVTHLEEAWKKIVPYKLIPSEVIPCAYPACKFSACFNKLDTHMNVHFPNYLCGVCGKSFVTDYRLRSHMQLHQIGEYPCNECSLVFNSQMKKKVHKEKVHSKKLLYKCIFCERRFESSRLKLQHLREEHEDMLETKGKFCNICEKSFWSKDFVRHMKFEHDKHMCQKCGRRFDRAGRLNKHKCEPEAPVKNFKCAICMRLFFTKEAVLMHISQKHDKSE